MGTSKNLQVNTKKAHSPYSPSSAEIYFNCPGAIASQAEAEPLPQNNSAKAGQRAHALGEHCLKNAVEPMDMIGQKITDRNDTFKVTEKMAESVQMYYDYVVELIASHPEAVLHVEVRLKAEFGDQEVFGTCDAIVIINDSLYVIDYKSGYKEVDSKQNKQLAIYGLLAMRNLGFFDAVTLVIVQPAGGGVKEWYTDTVELSRFEEELIKAIEESKANPKQLNPGDHCLWCKARMECGANKTSFPAYLDQRGCVMVLPELDELSNENLDDFLFKAQKFLKAFTKYAETGEEILLERLKKANKQTTHFEIGYVNKKETWADPKKAAQELYNAAGLKALNPKTPNQVRKLKIELPETIRPTGEPKLNKR